MIIENLKEALSSDSQKKRFLDDFFAKFKTTIEFNSDNEIYFTDEEIRDEAFNFCFKNSTDHSFYSRLFDKETKLELYERLLEHIYDADVISITIPDGVTSIEHSTFDECTSLKSITIPKSVTSIGPYAFCKCTSLKSITIPNSVTSIGSYAFCCCTSLTSITIPNSVTSIGNGAFDDCASLTIVYYKGTPTEWDNISIESYGNDKLTSATRYYYSETQPTESIVENLDNPLDEDIEKHDNLNPLLWNQDGTLKDEVHDKIIEIANDFIDNLKQDGIKFDLKDIRIVGSNCSYNYTKDSDLDVHLIADSSSLNCPDELYPLLYSSYRSIFNKNLNIDFYGIPVEIYVEVE